MKADDITDEITDEADTQLLRANEHQDTAQDVNAHEDQTQDYSDEQVQPAM